VPAAIVPQIHRAAARYFNGLLVDRLHNIMDNPSKKMVQETVDLMGHLRKVRKLTGTQLRIVGDIEKRCAELAG
jgi:hypothetical protein